MRTELFTVDYALNYLGWSYDKQVAPYNYYKIGDDFTVKVRRNDFYLLIFIYNNCDQEVFSDIIETIEEYEYKVGRNLHRWKCTPSSTGPVNPSQTFQIAPIEFEATFNDGDAVGQIIAYPYYDTGTLLNNVSIAGLNITVTPTYIELSGTVSSIYTVEENIYYIKGNTTNKVVTLKVKINIVFPPPIVGLQAETGVNLMSEDNQILMPES